MVSLGKLRPRCIMEINDVCISKDHLVQGLKSMLVDEVYGCFVKGTIHLVP